MKITVHLFIASVAILCLSAIAQKAQGVVPAPDGGYPGFTTAEGQKALFSLTTGSANTAVGWYSLFSNTAGSFNTATGAGTLLLNTGDENTAFGTAALLNNTTGNENTANGTLALFSNTTGGKILLSDIPPSRATPLREPTAVAPTPQLAPLLWEPTSLGAPLLPSVMPLFTPPQAAAISRSAISPGSISPPAAATSSLVTAA